MDTEVTCFIPSHVMIYTPWRASPWFLNLCCTHSNLRRASTNQFGCHAFAHLRKTTEKKLYMHLHSKNRDPRVCETVQTLWYTTLQNNQDSTLLFWHICSPDIGRQRNSSSDTKILAWVSVLNTSLGFHHGACSNRQKNTSAHNCTSNQSHCVLVQVTHMSMLLLLFNPSPH